MVQLKESGVIWKHMIEKMIPIYNNISTLNILTDDSMKKIMNNEQADTLDEMDTSFSYFGN